MPNSSGGGSHGGGAHSSPHGGSSGRSGVKISRTRFPGSRRYVTYHKGEQRYFYANKNYDPKYDFKRLLIGIIYLPFLLFIILSVKKSFPKVPKDYKHNIVITDEADVIADEWALHDSLEAFMNKTGVTPSVVSVYDDDWQESYQNLESYAYDRYLQEFGDEMHWLIVYSKPKVYTADGAADWQWKDLQGNDTDPVLKARETQKFNKKLTELLEDKSLNAGTAISEAFDYFTDNISLLPQLSVMIMPLFMLAFLVFHAYFMLGFNELKYRNAVPAPEEGIDDISAISYGEYEIKSKIADIASARGKKMCPYCGGVFAQSLSRCPHCNANVSDE